MKKNKIYVRDAVLRFTAFERAANNLGFSRISEAREKRDLEMQGVVKPKSRRLIGLENQVILEKQVDEYTIRVVTTYDPEKRKFPKNGKFWVLIVAPDEGKGREPSLFVWKTTRDASGNFLKRGLMMMEFLVSRLEQRPIDPWKNLMKLESRVGKSEFHPYVWTYINKHEVKKEVLSFFDGIPKNVFAFVYKWRRNLWYYETKQRIARGYKRREKDIRKKYTTTKMKKKK